MNTRRLLLVIFITLAGSLSAQNYIVRQFNHNNGLPSLHSEYAYRDSTGFIWLCCYGGLVRFDGTTFKIFNNSAGFTDYRLSYILEEEKNKFWICNNFKLYSFNSVTLKEQKTNLPPNEKLEKIIKLKSYGVIIQTQRGCYKRVNDSLYTRFTLFGIPSEKMYDIQEYGPYGIIIYNYTDQIIYHIVQQKCKEQFQLPKNELMCGVYPVNGQPYIALRHRMVCISHNQLVDYYPSGFNRLDHLTSIYQDRIGQLWYTDSSYHLWKQSGDERTDFTNLYHTPKIYFPIFIEDESHNLIIGHTHGLIAIRKSVFDELISPTKTKLPSVFISSIFSGDTLCYGIDKHALKAVTKKGPIEIPIYWEEPSLNEERNCTLFSTKNPSESLIFIRKAGLFIRRGNRILPYFKKPYDFTSCYLSHCYDSTENFFYTVKNDYILRMNETQVDSFRLLQNESGLVPANLCQQSDRSIYFTANDKYLFRLKNNHVENLTDQLNIHGYAFSLYPNKNQLWVLVHGIELREYSIQHGHLKLNRVITQKDGLYDANVYTLVFDEHDNIWLSGFSGLYFLRLSPLSITHQYYAKKVPIMDAEYESSAVTHINYSKGSLYCFINGGLLRMDTRSALFESKPVKTYFNTIKFNNKTTDELYQLGIAAVDKKSYSLPYSYNSASFDMNTIYYGFDDAIQYQYKLAGHSEEWKTLLKSNVITYNNLNPGTYTLWVRSVNEMNRSSFSGTQFEFTIRPPFYKTWWFTVLATLVGIAAIIGLIVLRDRRKLAENKLAIQLSELKLEALQSQMNPHFIFNALNSIQHYILKNEQIEAARYLSKFSKLIRRTLENSHHQLVSLDEIVDTLDMYMELESFRFNHEIKYTITMQKEDDRIYHVELPPMLLQPFVENAILHGLMPKTGEKSVDVRLFIEGDALHAVIDDNGVGRFHKPKKEGHVSRGQKLIEGMLESIKQLKMTSPTITFVDKINANGTSAGTTVHLRIPFETH